MGYSTKLLYSPSTGHLTFASDGHMACVPCACCSWRGNITAVVGQMGNQVAMGLPASEILTLTWHSGNMPLVAYTGRAIQSSGDIEGYWSNDNVVQGHWQVFIPCLQYGLTWTMGGMGTNNIEWCLTQSELYGQLPQGTNNWALNYLGNHITHDGVRCTTHGGKPAGHMWSYWLEWFDPSNNFNPNVVGTAEIIVS